MWRGSFTLVRRPRRVGPDLNTVWMLKSWHTPDALTHTCYVREEGRWWLLFICFIVIARLPRKSRNRSCFDEGSRIAVPDGSMYNYIYCCVHLDIIYLNMSLLFSFTFLGCPVNLSCFACFWPGAMLKDCLKSVSSLYSLGTHWVQKKC